MDLAPHVGGVLDIMRADTERARAGRPYVFTDLLRLKGLAEITSFIEMKGGLVR